MKLLTKQLEATLKKYPYLSQDGKRLDARVLVKFFGGGAYTFLVTEAEKDGSDWVFYGYGTIGYGYEFGSVTLSELQSIKFPPFGFGIERDICVNEKSKVSDFIKSKDLM